MSSDDTSQTIIYTTNGWNLARSIASDCVKIIEAAQESDGKCAYLPENLSCTTLTEQYAQAERTRNIWPFEDEQEMLDFVQSVVDISTDNLSTADIARDISDRLSESPIYQHVSDPLATQTRSEEDHADESEIESKEEKEVGTDSTPKTGVTSGKQNDDLSSDDGHIEDGAPTASIDNNTSGDSEKDNTEPSNDGTSETNTLSVAEINANSNRTEEVNPSFGEDTTAPLEDTSKEAATDGGSETDTNVRKPEIEPTQTAEEIAANLYACFVDDQADIVYSEVVDRHNAHFPKRSSALFETVNSRGSTKQERIDDLAVWVQQWLDDPEVIERVNKYSPDPMGSRPAT